MSRNELISEVKKYFQLKELVCPHCVQTYGDNAWQFLSTELLDTVYILRTQVLKQPIIVNNSSNFTQRGLRCNRCDIVKSKTKPYMSAHCLGKAIDFHCTDLDIKTIHQLIENNIDKFNYPIRLESIKSAPTWVHIDVYTLDCNKKFVEFTA